MDGRLRVGACLSLSGEFARFGRQAALGLKAWQLLDGTAELLIEDDRSDQRTLEAIFPDVAARCDVLLGPYSTILTRTAGRVAADSDLLVWNHGGSGDDVQQARPGHVISVLTPASRYAAPFIRYLADDDNRPRPLCIVHGPGKFGQQAAEGAATTAAQLGIATVRAGPDAFPPSGLSRPWDLFSAGAFEQDARLASRALALPDPPRRLCTVSAGVREFARAAGDPEGVFGIAQWFPGSQQEVLHGPSEEEFLRACAAAGGGVPDYPAAQAAAGAVIAAHCAKLAGSSRGEDLWAAAASLDTTTLFGGFRIDPASGVQVKHDTVLVRWTNGEPRALPGSCQPTP